MAKELIVDKEREAEIVAEVVLCFLLREKKDEFLRLHNE